MTLANETDPVEAIRLILANSAAGDWSNAGVKPTHIEAVQASQMKIKTQRSDPAVYIWRPADGAFEQFGANYDHYNETQVVQCEAWDKQSSDQAHNFAEDIRSICFQYATDNFNKTAWGEITPESDTDNRHESRAARRADHFVETVQVGLFARRTP